MDANNDLAPGTVIIVRGHSVGAQRRAGEILEVIGGPGHQRYRVRWDDDHESIFFPAEDVTVERFHPPDRPRDTASRREET
jgi:hypothetical protein